MNVIAGVCVFSQQLPAGLMEHYYRRTDNGIVFCLLTKHLPFCRKANYIYTLALKYTVVRSFVRPLFAVRGPAYSGPQR